MSILIKFVLVVSWFFSFCSESAHFRDAYPGSRSVCAIQMADDRSNMTLALRKKCQCASFSAYRDLCHCWSNDSKEDQPAIQGDANTLLKYVLKPFNPIFGQGFENGELVCRIPGPEIFAYLAKTKGIGDYFEYFPGKELVGDLEYLRLIAKGKIPLAGFDDNFKTDPMGLHVCLHDLFNHVAFWSFLPDHVRVMLQKRASQIVNLSDELENAFPKNSSELLIWHFLLKKAVIFFDTSTGILNGLLFRETIENTFFPDLSDGLQKVLLEKMGIAQSYSQLEMLLNFGMVLGGISEDSIEAVTYYNSKNWLWQFCNAMTKGVSKALKKRLEGQSEFDRLLALPQEEREQARTALLGEIRELLAITGGENDGLLMCFSFYDFIRQVKEQMLVVHQRCEEHTKEWLELTSKVIPQ